MIPEPCNYMQTHCGWPRSYKTAYKTNLLSPGESTLKFSHNYIPLTIPNESLNYSRPVIVCCYSGKDAIT